MGIDLYLNFTIDIYIPYGRYPNADKLKLVLTHDSNY